MQITSSKNQPGPLLYLSSTDCYAEIVCSLPKGNTHMLPASNHQPSQRKHTSKTRNYIASQKAPQNDQTKATTKPNTPQTSTQTARATKPRGTARRLRSTPGPRDLYSSMGGAQRHFEVTCEKILLVILFCKKKCVSLCF